MFTQRGHLSDRGQRRLHCIVALSALVVSACNQDGSSSAASARNPILDAELEICSEAIRRDPKSAEAFWNRGNVLFNRGQHDGAIKDYTEAIRLAPDAVGAYNSRGLVKRAQGQYDAAIVDFTEAIRIDPDFLLPYCSRGAALEHNGDDDKALKDYTDAIRINPKFSTAYEGRGVVWLKKRLFDKAKRDFGDAILNDPNYGLAYTRLAWLQATCLDANVRDGAKAVENGQKACEMSLWKDYYDIATLAAACAEAGDFSSAIKYQRQAMAMNNDDSGFARESRERLALYANRRPYREN